ncbi:2Fe-2S iron-sulfur cluster-binding protein [Moorella naiadis]|uniref:2Fe-2S iron-sulfur cluster-binding protein n=1 Tax=Moorella naiadis (nom. illeg.) TaxID=3093670 RepID=UPI003D9CB845
MSEAIETIKIKVQRFDPAVDKEPNYQEYTVPYAKGTTVMSALRYIYENLDHSLAYYASCRIGKCAGCHVRVNGNTKLACTTIIEGNVTIEPKKGKVIRDLVVETPPRGEKEGHEEVVPEV